jgi:CheY-like chemotaxis protein/anti-sigma regulatory factor (Ser/Thr protein kinase)
VTESSDPHRDLAGVLHDVSNALTVLLGWVGEARAPGATPEAVAYALTIIEQRARIARDLSRHAIGAPRIDEQREVGAIVREVAEALLVEAQRAGVRLSVTSANSVAKVAGALDVSQVLTNLVMNALAYAPRGTAVEVSLSVEDERCTIIVTDEGPGVAPERRESIFQGDSARVGGSGVGLRHSRALAKAWRGDVEYVDHGGTGARFRVTWPRVDALPRPPMSASRMSDLAGIRVLVLEDDVAVTQLLETALEARGAEVTIATNAAQFDASLAKGPYAAALVDLSPIAQDASGALKRLRASCPDAAVVLVTGNADTLPEVDAGVPLELVRKPFEVREVLAVLGCVVERAKAP